MSYYGSSRYRDAATQLKLASEAQPDNLELRYTLAQSYLWSDQYPEASTRIPVPAFEEPGFRARSRAPGAGTGRERAGSRPLRRSSKRPRRPHPRSPEVHFGLGYLYWKRKRYQEAGREFQAELANQREHVQALTYLGDVEMQAGNDKAAEDHLPPRFEAGSGHPACAPRSGHRPCSRWRVRRGHPAFSGGDSDRPLETRRPLPPRKAVEFHRPGRGGAVRIRQSQRSGE